MNICPNCQKPVSEQFKHCPYCGSPLKQPPAPKSKKHIPKPLIAVWLVLLAVTLVTIGILMAFTVFSDHFNTFDFNNRQYTEKVNAILGETWVVDNKWVVNEDKNEYVYTDDNYEIKLQENSENKKVSQIEVSPPDNEYGVKMAAVSLMVIDPRMTQDKALDMIAKAKKDKSAEAKDQFRVTVTNEIIQIVPLKTDEETTSPPTEVKKEYTAMDLIKMDLSEIIKLMGDDYKLERKTLSVGFGSDGNTLMVFNESTLPGLAVCPSYSSGIYEDVENNNNVREKIRQGSYDYQGIAVYDKGKLNDKISADMTYNELAKEIGEFNTEGVAQETLAYTTKTDGYRVSYYFSTYDYSELGSRIDNGTVSSSDMKDINPKLKSIAVFKEESSNTTTTAPDQNVDWKKMYIECINENHAKNDTASYSLVYINNDSIPELNILNTKGSWVDYSFYLYWIHNGKLCKEEGVDLYAYNEKSGEFICSHRYGFDSNKMNGDKIQTIHSASENMNYFIVDNEHVDETTYRAAITEINKYGNKKPEYKSKEEIINEINNH